ncbi:hypothetical protein M9H77_12355 [Catharanthus roseus]|uniref:Uncharacterized protein n=1 Tax=Catharanthus roseus TaxID=4058 RepID=A0ACC0BH76_CATRO|nr:hypothetical protein M9H77_12355 [Catharanthus roseus]
MPPLPPTHTHTLSLSLSLSLSSSNRLTVRLPCCPSGLHLRYPVSAVILDTVRVARLRVERACLCKEIESLYLLEAHRLNLRDSSLPLMEGRLVTAYHYVRGNRTHQARSVSFTILAENLMVSSCPSDNLSEREAKTETFLL